MAANKTVIGPSVPVPSQGFTDIVAAAIMSDADAADANSYATLTVETSRDGGASWLDDVVAGWQGGLDKANNPCPPGVSLGLQANDANTVTHARVKLLLPQSINVSLTVTFQ